MANSQELVARTTIRIAGVFQEITEAWVRRLDSYYSQLDSLVKGDWLGPDDLKGILAESKMASREALNGLGNDLSAQLVHESSGLLARFEIERTGLCEEISDLKMTLDDFASNDKFSVQIENQMLKKAIFSIPNFQVLQALQNLAHCSYSKLSEITGHSKRELKKIMKLLCELGYVEIDKGKRPHVIKFISAPWNSNAS
jgi:hypothetical protein